MGAGGKGGDNAAIEIFVRVKPSNKASPNFAYDLAETKVDFNLPRDSLAGYVNNQREHYEYKFNGVIPPDAKQDEVFERVARNALSAVMEGINSTLFAYGQTGSGKTFTMTGGVERYVDRGIIPRAISAIFADVAKRADSQYAVHISYLEIYQDTGYDLLDPTQDAKTLEDLPRVSMMEDDAGRVHLRNLSMHRANSEEDALNLLFLGDTNRTISETPMNMASSRSHCVFTVYVESRKEGSDKVRRSKLHLVDLAGSERVSKTGVDGTTLREAKYINLSLHYLEQVIIALQEMSTGSGRTHVPYRNSMMTSVLRDSLGGNCRTAMIATVATEAESLDESISTCRFALRVAMVSNTITVNEEVDPSAIIKRLKSEIRELKEELRLLKGDDAARGELTEGELERLRRQCEAYVADPDDDATIAWESMLHVRAAMSTFRRLCRGAGATTLGAAAGAGARPAIEAKVAEGGGEGGGVSDGVLAEQIKRYKLQVQQRDNEINILVSMLKKTQSASGQVLAEVPVPQPKPREPAPTTAAAAQAAAPVDVAELLADRNKAFEVFRKSYRKNEAIEENKALLKAKYGEAKGLGETVNATRQRINALKAGIEQRRVQRGVAGVADGEDAAEVAAAAAAAEAEEAEAKRDMEAEKGRYKASFERLRNLKKEIEHLQLLLEQSRQKLQGDFEKWLETMLRQREANDASFSGKGGAALRASAATAVSASTLQLRTSNGDLRAAGATRPAVVTGNADADADIAAFYEAKEKLMKARMSMSVSREGSLA